MSDKDIQSKKEKKKEKGSIRRDIIEIALFMGIAVLLIFGFNWLLGVILHTNSPLVVVISPSMEPSYMGHKGDFQLQKDMLIIRGVNPSKIKQGDTIVFYRLQGTNLTAIDYDAIPIVHRVNRVYKNNTTGEYWFTTKGDNPETNDNFLPGGSSEELRIHESRLIGKVVGRIPYLGGITKAVQTRTGMIVLISIVALFFIIAFLFGEEEDEDVFEEETIDSSPKNDEKASSENKFKKFWRRIQQRKQYIYPALILGIIILIPVVDTLCADWGTTLGVSNIEYKNHKEKTLIDGNYTFVFAEVTLNNPGHWHQNFDGYTIRVINPNTTEVLGENYWYLVYNFEGTITLNHGAWVNTADLINGTTYEIVITAHLSNKFGKSWTNNLTTTFEVS
ncbi:MAG: signal peptidase I [Asgard group archaeon]|nr:signal peptidase I [Asgard group archaeon]